MIMSKRGIIPGKEYYHNPNIIDNEGKTVCYYLWDNGIMVPEEW